MNLKFHLIITGLLLLLFSSVEASREKAVMDMNLQTGIQPPSPLDFCQMTRACDYPSYEGSWITSGNRLVTYYNPELECSTPVYPFAVSTLWVTFFELCSPCIQWPFQVDIVIYDLAQPGDPCSGPGAELYRESFSCDRGTYGYPNIGPLNLAAACCVNGPVFIGIEYTDQPFGRYHPVLLGDESHCPPVDCLHWGGFGNNWWEWTEYWGGETGAPSFWVDGESNSINCAPNQDIPTLSQWGMLIMGLILLTCGTIGVIFNRRTFCSAGNRS